MNITGEEFIKIICNRLIHKKELCRDSNIIREINKITSSELKQITDLDNMTKFKNEYLDEK